MKNLNLEEMEMVEGGKGWGCAGAILGSMAITVGAAAIASGTGGAGVGLAVFLIAKAGSICCVIDACSSK